MGEYLIVGKVIEPHGIRGWVKLASFSDYPGRFVEGRRFITEREPGEREELILEEVREAPGILRVKFTGVDSRNDALALKGRELLITEDEVGEPPEGAFWEHQILGLRVLTVDGAMLGEVAEILYTAGNDIYVVRGEREYLIPATREVVVDIDLAEGQLTIEPIPGLLEP